MPRLAPMLAAEAGALLAATLPEDVIRVLWQMGADLTPAEWSARLGIAEMDVATVVAWVRGERAQAERHRHLSSLPETR